MKRTKITTEIIRNMVEAGYGKTVIAKRLHMAVSTLEKALNTLGLTAPTPSGRLSKKASVKREIRFIEAMIRDEMTRLTTAQALGISIPQLDYKLRKYGLSFRTHKITEYEINFMRRHYGKMSVIEIAREIGFCPATVYTWVKRIGLVVKEIKLPNGDTEKICVADPAAVVMPNYKAGKARPPYITEHLPAWRFNETEVNTKKEYLYTEVTRTLMLQQNRLSSVANWDEFAQKKEYNEVKKMDGRKIAALKRVCLQGKQTPGGIKLDLDLV